MWIPERGTPTVDHELAQTSRFARVLISLVERLHAPESEARLIVGTVTGDAELSPSQLNAALSARWPATQVDFVLAAEETVPMSLVHASIAGGPALWATIELTPGAELATIARISSRGSREISVQRTQNQSSVPGLNPCEAARHVCEYDAVQPLRLHTGFWHVEVTALPESESI